MNFLKLLLFVCSFACYAESPIYKEVEVIEKGSGAKVLYITHTPGKYHDYVTQLKEFKKIAEKKDWKVDYISGSHEDTLAKLGKKDFAEGYDVLVYNICMAHDNNIEAIENMISQTRDKGIPAFLIHCTMHSFWPTYANFKLNKKKDKKGKKNKKGKKDKKDQEAISSADSDPELVKQWQKKHGDKAFPSWGDFTGVASSKHSKRTTVEVTKDKDHPIIKGIPDKWQIGPKAELYLELYRVDGVASILTGTVGKDKASVLWTHKQGKGNIVGFSLGHGQDEWKNEHFRSIIINSIDYLYKNK